MGKKLDMKLWIVASLGVFVLLSILEYIAQQSLMIRLYPELYPQAVPPEQMTPLRVYVYGGRAFFALIFVYIFTRGLEGKPGIREGAMYGLLVGLLTQVPGVFGNLVASGRPDGAIVLSAVAGIVELVLCGILTNLLYKRKAGS